MIFWLLRAHRKCHPWAWPIWTYQEMIKELDLGAEIAKWVFRSMRPAEAWLVFSEGHLIWAAAGGNFRYPQIS